MSRKAMRAAATTASFSGAAMDAKENAAMRAKADILWDAFVDIGAAGKHLDDFAALNPASKAGFKAMLLAGFAEMPLATLRGACFLGAGASGLPRLRPTGGRPLRYTWRSGFEACAHVGPPLPMEP